MAVGQVSFHSDKRVCLIDLHAIYEFMTIGVCRKVKRGTHFVNVAFSTFAEYTPQST